MVGHRGIHDSTAALSFTMTLLGSSLFTTALPDTIILAPACMTIVYVTGFAKRGLIHASNFATLMSHNFVYD